MPSIMDAFRGVFGGQPQQPQSAQLANLQPGNPGVHPQHQQLPQRQAPANPMADPTLQQQTQVEESPLKAFEGLWNIDPKQLEAQPPALTEFAFNVKPEDVRKAARGVDFTKAISPEILEKIQAGGPEATAALLQAMNVVGQQAFAEAALVSSKTVEAGIKMHGANVEKALPGAVRRETISHALREDNPLFTDPATAPTLAVLESQLGTRYPNATPAQIKEHAKNYLTGFAETAARVMGTQKTSQQPGTLPARGEIDWSQEPV